MIHFGYSMMIEIAQMALSYYLNKLRKDCFLKHHAGNNPESSAQARAAICRTVQSIQMIQSASRISAEACYSTRWQFENASAGIRLPKVVI